MQLFSNVHSVLVDKNIESDMNVDDNSLIMLNDFLIKGLKMHPGDIVIVTGSIPHLMSGESTNFLKIHTVSDK